MVCVVVSMGALYSKKYGIQMSLRHTVPIMCTITKAVFPDKD